MSTDAADNIRARLDATANERVESIEWFETLASTNDYLLAAPRPEPGMLKVAIADEQTSGRGRNKKAWLSQNGHGLWMSVAYTFSPVPEMLSSLTLAIGADIVRCLNGLGAEGIALKWPNDLMLDDRKLAGILVESRTAASSTTTVSGIGINILEPEAGDFAEIAGRENLMLPVGLEYALEQVPTAEELAAHIVATLVGTFDQFAQDGLQGFVGDWSKLDWLHGRRVNVIGEPHLCGTADGINDNGELIIKNGNVEFSVVAGTVRLSEEPE